MEPGSRPQRQLLGPALVTGASSGIGLELANLLAAAGHDLVLVARREAELRSLADALEREFQTRSRVVALDLAQPGAAASLARTLADEGIELEILINNAGFGVHGPFVDTDLQAEPAGRGNAHVYAERRQRTA